MIYQPFTLRLILMVASTAAAVFVAGALLHFFVRSVLGIGSTDFEELALLVFRWAMLLAVPAAFIGRDPALWTLIDRRVAPWQRAVGGLAASIGALVCAIVTFAAVEQLRALIAGNLTMLVFDWPLWLLYLPFAVGFALAFVALIWLAIARFSGRLGRSPSQP